MEEQLIIFETAKLAKQKGFIRHKGERSMYGETGNLFTAVGPGYDMQECSEAPTQSLLQRWLREKHKIHLEIRFGGRSGDNKFSHFGCKIYKPITGLELYINNPDLTHNSHIENYKYEEALEFGLQEALKLI